MTTRRHHNSKSSGAPAELLKSPEVRSPHRKTAVASFLGSSSSQPSLNMTKSLLEKFLKQQTSMAHAKHRSIKSMVSPKPMNLRRQPVCSPKSMSMSLKDPNFEIEASKELSVIRSVRTPRTTASTAPQRGIFTESSSAKSTPQTQSTHFQDCVHREQFESQVIQLELKLTEQLKESNKHAPLPGAFETQFPIFSQMFQEVIDRDRQFGSLLAKIKGWYEEWLKTFSKKEKDEASQKQYEQCADQLRTAKQKLKLWSEDRKLMLRRIGNLSKETLELSQNLEELELENEDLKAKLDRIRNVDLNLIPLTEEAWKYVVEENHTFRREVRRLRQKLKLAATENDSLQILIDRMRDRGFPIEELETPVATEKSEELDELEPIASGPAKAMDKPKNVPILKLQELQKDSGRPVADSGHADSLEELRKTAFGKELKDPGSESPLR